MPGLDSGLVADFGQSASYSNPLDEELQHASGRQRYLESLIESLESQVAALDAAMRAVKAAYSPTISPFRSPATTSPPMLRSLIRSPTYSFSNHFNNQTFNNNKNSSFNDAEMSEYLIAAIALERLCLILFCSGTVLLAAVFFIYGFSLQEPFV